jgi:hypothetical protein
MNTRRLRLSTTGPAGHIDNQPVGDPTFGHHRSRNETVWVSAVFTGYRRIAPCCRADRPRPRRGRSVLENRRNLVHAGVVTASCRHRVMVTTSVERNTRA